MTGSDKSFRKSTLGAAKGQQTKGPNTGAWEASQQVVAAEQVSKNAGLGSGSSSGMESNGWSPGAWRWGIHRT